jgi:DNA repair protein RecN (Recombination protein N)
MLKYLRISQLVLIESLEIAFEPQLNVLSGETGSGKSALIEALALVLGGRADTALIRRGQEKGAVEAIFSIEAVPDVQVILQEAGIDFDLNEDLIIRRELSVSGKNRSFINHQAAHVTLLKQVGEHLVRFVGQHANQQLLALESHRAMVDRFGDIEPIAQQFKEAWEEEGRLRERLLQLTSSESQRLRQIEIYQMELEEIGKAEIKEGEEEELFAEYSKLTYAEEIIEHLHALGNTLKGEKYSVIGSLNRQKANLEALAKLDPSLEDTLKAYQDASIVLQEVSYTLDRYSSRVEHSPQKTAELNERLTLINRLKKKYGPELSDIQTYRNKAEQELQQLENADHEIEALQTKLNQASAESNTLATQLTQGRQVAAKAFAERLVQELRSLNMPKVEFKIEVTPQKRSSTGDDRIEFFMAPNLGEHYLPVKDYASGGEMSRLMLAIQKLLSGKDQIATLIFDEIDANIGGATAAVIGDKLAQISLHHQILCITHFPQVAQHAKHHLQIAKQEQEGRTLTTVKSLKSSERKKELARMVGIEK